MESIREREGESYRQQLGEWRKVEVINQKLLAIAEKERQERMRREYAAHMSELGMSVVCEKEEVVEVRECNNGEIEGEGEGVSQEKDEQCGERTLSSSDVSSSSATPVATHQNTPFEAGCVSDQTPPSATLQTPPPAGPSRSASPELITLSEITSTTLPPHSTHPPNHHTQDYIITPQDDVVTETRSSSVDSGHSSNCNLGNSIGSSQGNSLVNGCHVDNSTGDDSLVEWNGHSGMELGPEVGDEVTSSSGTIVADTAEEMREGEGEGEERELELDVKGRMFADELFKIDKDIPRCDRDYW